MRLLSLVALQLSAIPGDPAGSFKQFCDRVRAIPSTFPKAQLVLLPELHLTGPGELLGTGRPTPAELAEPIPGPTTERLGELARETGLWLVPGSLYEAAGGVVYNTAVVIAPDGSLRARYRKIFPWQPYERTAPGGAFVTFDMDGVGRIGLAICYDGTFPEMMRQLAWMGAEVVLQPTLTSTADRAIEVVAARANALFNQLYVVSMNAPSPAGLGRSMIVDPEGVVRYQAGVGEEVITDVLDLDAVTRVRAHGTYGLNRLWDQLDRHGADLELPMYGGRFQPRPEGFKVGGVR